MKPVNRVEFKDTDFQLNADAQEQIAQIMPMGNNVIVRIIKSEAKSAGGIVLASADVEKSTLGVVLKPNVNSYNKDGSPGQVCLMQGDLVRLHRGNVGTTMPEAPDGEEWISVPEDCIYYYKRIKV